MSENERQSNQQNINWFSSRKVLIAVVASVVLLLGVLTGFAAANNKIFSGVSVCDTDLGGMTIEEARGVLEQKFVSAGPKITISAEGLTADMEFGSFAEYDFNKSAENAFGVGREMGPLSKVFVFSTPFVKRDLPLTFYLNVDSLSEKLTEIQSGLENPYVETTCELSDEKLIIKTGHEGNTIDAEDVTEKIKNALGSNEDINVETKTTFKKFDGVNIDKIYKEVAREPEDARYEDNGKESKLITHVVGVSFDKDKAKEIIGEAKPDTTYEIPVIITYPEITEAKLTGELFSEVISTYSTNYNPGEVDRTHNMVLASNKVNGTILNPGQVFSYNGVVGKRTVAAGYRNAKVFENGRVVDGLAGGICQVSSTIYNAALYGNMEIVERKNHSFPVSYAPMGQDATVVMGSLDFKFKNSTTRPIKIVSSISGGKCTVTLLGTKENNFKVRIDNVVVGSTPFGVKYVNDPTLEPGVEKVLQSGSNGYTVKSTRVVTVDGQVVKQESLPSSYYIPLHREIARNEEIDPEASPSPEENPEAMPSEEPTAAPSGEPEATTEPTEAPTIEPTVEPTAAPTEAPEPEYTLPPYDPDEE